MQLTKTVAYDCARRGYNIRCNAVLPGTIETTLYKTFSEEQRAANARGVPAGPARHARRRGEGGGLPGERRRRLYHRRPSSPWTVVCPPSIPCARATIDGGHRDIGSSTLDRRRVGCLRWRRPRRERQPEHRGTAGPVRRRRARRRRSGHRRRAGDFRDVGLGAPAEGPGAGVAAVRRPA